MVASRDVITLAVLISLPFATSHEHYTQDNRSEAYTDDKPYTDKQEAYTGQRDDNEGRQTTEDTTIPPPDERWEEWRHWSECSVTCGVGVKVRSRSCMTLDVGLSCEGSAHEEEPCELGPCPNNKAEKPHTTDEDADSAGADDNAEPGQDGHHQETGDDPGDDPDQEQQNFQDDEAGRDLPEENADDCGNDGCNNQNDVNEEGENDDQSPGDQDDRPEIDDDAGDDFDEDDHDDVQDQDETFRNDEDDQNDDNNEDDEDFGEEKERKSKPRHASTASDNGENNENDDNDDDVDDDHDDDADDDADDGGESGNEEDDEGDAEEDEDDDDKAGSKRRKKKPRPEDEEEEEEEDKDEEEEEEEKKKKKRKRRKKKKKKKHKKKKDESDTLVQEDSAIRVEASLNEEVASQVISPQLESSVPELRIEGETIRSPSQRTSTGSVSATSSGDGSTEDSSYSSSWSTGDESDTSESYSYSSGFDKQFSFGYSDSVFGSEPCTPESMPASPMSDIELPIGAHSSPKSDRIGTPQTMIFERSSSLSPINITASKRPTSLSTSSLSKAARAKRKTSRSDQDLTRKKSYDLQSNVKRSSLTPEQDFRSALEQNPSRCSVSTTFISDEVLRSPVGDNLAEGLTSQTSSTTSGDISITNIKH